MAHLHRSQQAPTAASLRALDTAVDIRAIIRITPRGSQVSILPHLEEHCFLAVIRAKGHRIRQSSAVIVWEKVRLLSRHGISDPRCIISTPSVSQDGRINERHSLLAWPYALL